MKLLGQNPSGEELAKIIEEVDVDGECNNYVLIHEFFSSLYLTKNEVIEFMYSNLMVCFEFISRYRAYIAVA